MESRPIEEVLFLRDEMANLAWAVERLVESPAERPLNRFEAYLEKKRRREQERPPQLRSAETLRYRLSTEVPDYWIPLMPVRTGARAASEAWRGAQDTDGSPERSCTGADSGIGERAFIVRRRSAARRRPCDTQLPVHSLDRWLIHLWIGRRKGLAVAKDRAACGLTLLKGEQ